MQISYCIEQDQIQLCHSLLAENTDRRQILEVIVTNCAHPFSVMQISGKINDLSDVSFLASSKPGVIACVQLIKNGYLMEFNTSDCLEMDYCRNIIDIRFITAEVPFRFRYLKGGSLKRIDIFLTQQNLGELFNQSFQSLLQRNGHFVIDRVQMKRMGKKIEKILDDSDCAYEREKLCLQTAKLIEIIKEWSCKT